METQHPLSSPSPEDLARNYGAVRARIDAAATRAGRRPDDVRLIAVSKTHPPEVLRAALEAGINDFGENRPQEIQEKATAPGLEAARFTAIGQLQTNKAKILAAYASEFQALDSLKQAAALSRRLEDTGRELDVLIQVNSSAEPQKAGIPPEQVCAFAHALLEEDHPRLHLKGLMTVALNSPVTAEVAACFTRMQDAQQRLGEAVGEEYARQLSMGMSGDYELAVAHGSTCVRVGRAIFGART